MPEQRHPGNVGTDRGIYLYPGMMPWANGGGCGQLRAERAALPVLPMQAQPLALGMAGAQPNPWEIQDF